MGAAASKGTARHASAAAELAITLPFLALMFTAALDFCRVYYASQAIQNCAYVAALYASGTVSNPNASSPTAAAQQAAVAECPTLNPPLQSTNVTVTSSASQVVVTVAYDFPMLTPFLGNNGVTPISRSATMTLAPGGP